jgi:hypothetical protein
MGLEPQLLAAIAAVAHRRCDGLVVGGWYGVDFALGPRCGAFNGSVVVVVIGGRVC